MFVEIFYGLVEALSGNPKHFDSFERMNQHVNRLIGFAGSRIALNIYFWIFLLTIKLPDADDQVAYPKMVYYAIIVLLMSFFAALAYVNNLFLQPRLLFKNKRLAYLLAALSLVLCVDFIYVFLLKWIPTVLPGFDIIQMSIIMSPFDSDLSLSSILNDMPTFIGAMIIWVVVFSLLGFYHHSRSKMLAMEAALQQHRETELTFLRHQLNPHFLFNTLNNIYGLSLKNSKDVPETIQKLSTILRYMLYESNHALVPFEKEREIMQAYIDIELLRLEESPTMQFSIAASTTQSIPPLIWLPILENVFKHTRKIASPDIHFRFQLQQDSLHLYCSNTFIPDTEEKTTGGIGLETLRKRLALLYPDQHRIAITTDEKTFIIELWIQLKPSAS